MALGPGSIAFVGINTNGQDWLAFAAIDPIPAGTVIYFTDNELPSSNSTSFNGSPTGGETYTKWTATSDVAAGTVINFSVFYTGGALNGGITVSTGTAVNVAFTGSANAGLSTTQDSVYAYLAASDATVDTPTTFLSFINIGTTADPVPAALAANQQITFVTTANSAYYTGPHDNQLTFAGFLNEINNPANWTLGAGTTDNSTLNASPFVLDTPPVLLSSAPADNATGFSPASDIVLTFDQTVQEGTGNILIKNVSDDSVVQMIDITSGAVTVSGNMVTINPPADLVPNHSYYIEIAAGAIKDTTNNNFPGILGATTLNFTTAASETQTVAFGGSLTLAQEEGQTGTTDYVFTVARSGGTTGDVSFSGTFASATTDNADYTGGEPVSFSGNILAGQESQR